MKKILLTSTALVAFAGAAAAEVSISGSAEMGIVGGDGIETQFFQDIDVTFKMSGETDGGLSFGAAIDIDEVQSSTSGATNETFDDGGVAIFISGGFGTLTLGDTDGAMDWALTEAGNIGNPGSIADNETAHAGYLGSYHDGQYDGQILRYDNTFGDFGVAISFEMGDDIETSADRDIGYAIGLKYNIELASLDLALGLGYQSVDLVAGDGGDAEIIGFSVTTTFDNGLEAGIVYTAGDIFGIEDSTHIGLGLGYSQDAFSVHFNYGMYDFDGFESTGYGLAAAYDLGGGASLKFGYGHSDVEGFDSTNDYSIGLAMSF